MQKLFLPVLFLLPSCGIYTKLNEAVDGLDLDPTQFTTSDICNWLLKEAERHKEALR